jgi:GntR family transcriptional regulator, transcriptional repressor for pyruvate dehydrogenase complex
VAQQKIQSDGFRAVQKVSICEDIIEQVKTLVRNNHFGPGSRLPSERELAEHLSVSRPSLREALRTLAIMGVLQTRQGSGTQVADSSKDILKAPFEFMLILDQPSISEMYETRELIEVFLSGQAAERRTSEDLVLIEQALHDMRDNMANRPAMNEANVRFHEAVAAAAHNMVLDRVMSSLCEGIRACIEASSPGVRDWMVSYEIHEEIFNAVRNQDSESARRAMSQHMRDAIENLRRAEARASSVNSTQGERAR